MKLVLHEDTPQPYALTRAILLYACTNANTWIAVEHDIGTRDNTPYLGAGRFVTNAFLDSLGELLDTRPLAYIPEHVVAVNRDAIAWYEPAALRRMYFRSHNDPAVNAFDAVELAQPPLVFVARRRMLSVFALLTSERPTLESPLAYAPYFNVHENGNVCLGSMRLPETIEPNDTEKWTHAFFASEFTHFTGTKKRWAHPGTYAELLGDLKADGIFAPTWLKSSDRTLKEAICSR